ncbi:MAG: NAD-dependent epimerase/dehydratase family protein [Bacteroidales bacterium]|nr:NAD-dependent epimerase/dehydratase family protein [Bacteroidales bacterium]MBR5028476.1 NAD-dependent epimerase/dehydratase family protein [Bacteroidales bacterium]
MRVLLTGANGLLGHNIVFRLLQQGHEVNVIVRKAESLCVNDEKLNVFVGSFLNHSDLLKAAEGCEAVIHAAATTDMSLLHYSDFEKVIVHGSQNVIDVCNEVGIKNIVYISSANTIGYGTAEQLATESEPMQAPFTESFYARAKKNAEELFVNQSQRAENHVIIVNPTFMLGAYDTKPSSGAMLLAAHRKFVAFATKGGKNFVHVGDVAQAAVNALTMGLNGERYIAGGNNLSIRQLYELQKMVSGYPKHVIVLPVFLAKCAGVLGDLLRKCHLSVSFSSVNIRQLYVREYYSSQKAVQQLQMPQTPVKEAIAESLLWFVNIGKIRTTKKLSDR